MLGLKLNYVSKMGYREMKTNINLMHGQVICITYNKYVFSVIGDIHAIFIDINIID